MAGYIGSKAVNLSTTGADINGDANIDGDLSFRDNDKIKLGAGSDLQIYHDGSNSFISDESTGNLVIRGSSEVSIQDPTGSRYSARFVDTDAVRLYHNGSQKLATTSTGIDVTGTVTADGLTVDGNATLQNILNIGGSDPQIRTDTSDGSDNKTLWMGGGGIAYSWDRGGFFYAQGNEAGGHVGITAGNVSGGSVKFTTGGTERMRITSSGSVGIGTSSPSSLLTIHGSQPIITLSDPDSGSTSTISGNSGHLILNADSGSDASNNTIDFQVDNDQKMRIDSSGNVGIGHVPSGNLTSGYVLRLDGGAQTYLAFNNDTHTTQVTGGFVIGNDSSSARITQRENQPIIFDTNNTEAMRIDSSGNVGIGTTSTAGHSNHTNLFLGGTGAIHVEKAATADASLHISQNAHVDTDGSWEYRVTDEATNYYQYAGTHVWRYAASGTAGNDISWSEAMRINSSGNLLVGTTSLTTQTDGFRVFPTGSSGGTLVECFNDDGGTALIVGRGGSDGECVRFYRGSTEVGSIDVTTTSTSYGTSSDYRLKENVTYDWDATTRLKQLKPARFNFIADADTTVDGFLAHEVQTIVPEAITGEKDEVDAEGNPVYQGIDQSKLVPLLTAALQEALDEITDLKARVATLEAN